MAHSILPHILKYPNLHFGEPYIISKYMSSGEMHPNDTKRVEFFLKYAWHSKSEKLRKLHEIEEIAQNKMIWTHKSQLYHLRSLSPDRVNHFFEFLFLCL